MLDDMGDTMGEWRNTTLAQTIDEIGAQLDLAWARLLSELDVAPGSPDETALSWLVVDNPAEHDWHIVNAALDRLTCTECGSTLTRGSATCQRCTYYHGMRSPEHEERSAGYPTFRGRTRSVYGGRTAPCPLRAGCAWDALPTSPDSYSWPAL